MGAVNSVSGKAIGVASSIPSRSGEPQAGRKPVATTEHVVSGGRCPLRVGPDGRLGGSEWVTG